MTVLDRMGRGGRLRGRGHPVECVELAALRRCCGRKRQHRGYLARTTVFPFILRGVVLLGIDSVRLPIGRRRDVWQRLGGNLLPPAVDDVATDEIRLDDVPRALSRILAGSARGRTLVRLS